MGKLLLFWIMGTVIAFSLSTRKEPNIFFLFFINKLLPNDRGTDCFFSHSKFCKHIPLQLKQTPECHCTAYIGIRKICSKLSKIF